MTLSWFSYSLADHCSSVCLAVSSFFSGQPLNSRMPQGTGLGSRPSYISTFSLRYFMDLNNGQWGWLPKLIPLQASVSVNRRNFLTIVVTGSGMGRPKPTWTNKMWAKTCWGLLNKDFFYSWEAYTVIQSTYVSPCLSLVPLTPFTYEWGSP